MVNVQYFQLGGFVSAASFEPSILLDFGVKVVFSECHL